MKKIIGIIIVLLFVVDAIPVYSSLSSNHQLKYENDIAEIINQVSENMIYLYIKNLTSYGPRLTATQSCHDAGKYIYNEFLSMNLDVRYQNWSYASDYYGSNIEATLPGSNPESEYIFIISAHYDSTHDSPGADDDASGVAAVLSAANILRQYSFEHTIRFVTFSGEEQGLHGSYYHAEEAYNNNDNIIGVFNVDPIGYAPDEEASRVIAIRDNEESRWLTNHTIEIAQQFYEYIGLDIVTGPAYTGMSDHQRYWEFGYDAIWFTLNQSNPYWHSTDDIIDNCNIEYAKNYCRLIIATIADLAQNYLGDTPIEIPSWDVGDDWTYHIDFYADFGLLQKEIAYGSSDNLIYTVVEDSGEDYIVEFNGQFSGRIETAFASIKITRFTEFSGNLIVQKSDLSIKEYVLHINGISCPMNGNKMIPIPIPLQMSIQVKMEPSYQIMPFPLYNGKCGSLPSSTLEHFGYISLMFGYLFYFEKEWTNNAIDQPYRCDKEIITIGAESYDAYKIYAGFMTSYVENHYAPEVGNIVKQKVWSCKEVYPNEPYIVIEQELTSTTYEP